MEGGYSSATGLPLALLKKVGEADTSEVIKSVLRAATPVRPTEIFLQQQRSL
jgi:hypothetical protein